MKKHIFVYLHFCCLAGCMLCASSCDKINSPYARPNGNTGMTQTAYVKKILLEDYTAQQCIYCPQAAVIAKQLRKSYPGRVITLGVHISSLAQPGASPFTYDFRTVPGTNYDGTFGLSASGLPTGMIDRIQYQSGYPIDRNNWQSVAATELAVPCQVFLTITNTYNAGTRMLITSIKTKFLSALTGNYNLVVLVSEDSIVKPQKDVDSTQFANDVVLNYMHHYVLRAAINGNGNGNGELLVVPHTPLQAGDSVISNYSYSLPPVFPSSVPNIPCNDRHCYVVAFISDASSNVVLQAEEQKIR